MEMQFFFCFFALTLSILYLIYVFFLFDCPLATLEGRSRINRKKLFFSTYIFISFCATLQIQQLFRISFVRSVQQIQIF